MFSRQAVIDRWQQCLAEAESLAAGPPSRHSFYYRMRVRLYRFLLACYGSGDWRADESVPTEDGEASNQSAAMPLVGPREPWEGKPPKAGDSIRSALEHIHAANEDAASAGSSAGKRPAWIAATARSAGLAPPRVRHLLWQNGIQARLVRRGDDIIIEVPRGHFDRAVQLIAGHRDQLRIRRQRINAATIPASFIVAGLILTISVCLTITAAHDYAAGNAIWPALKPWGLTLVIVAVGYAVFRLWTMLRSRRPRKMGPNRPRDSGGG